MYSVIGIGIAAALVGIVILAILVAGVKSMMNGKQDFKKIATFLVPFIAFGVAYAITGTLSDAGIAAMLFMMAVTILVMLFTGLRSTFNI